jgi:diguanylate cyclase (GGDEF)-like protein
LPNRRALEEELVRCASRARREKNWLSVVALDVDHFKKFNDTHGHAAGDAVLATLGRVLTEQCRKGDMPARYGGEEFSVVLPNTNAVGANVVAERIRRALEASETLFEGKKLKFTSSIGVASAHAEGVEPVASLTARADEALYAAKRGGRNRVVSAPPRAEEAPVISAAPRINSDFGEDEEDTVVTRVSALLLPGE